MSRTLVITQSDDGYFTASTDKKFSDMLAFDECLGVVASWLLNQPMRYMSEMESHWEIRRKTQHEVEKFLRPVDRLLIQERRQQQAAK